MIKQTNQVRTIRAQSLVSAFEDEQEVEDEDDEGQRQQRIDSLKNQDILWTNQKERHNSIRSRRRQTCLYQNCSSRESSAENFENYFNKFRGMSANFIRSSKDPDQDSFEQDELLNGESSLQRLSSIKQDEIRGSPKVMCARLANTERWEEYKESQDEKLSEFDTPTPCDEEYHGIDQHMRYYNLPNQKPNNQQDSPDSNNSFTTDQNQLKMLKKNQEHETAVIIVSNQTATTIATNQQGETIATNQKGVTNITNQAGRIIVSNQTTATITSNQTETTNQQGEIIATNKTGGTTITNQMGRIVASNQNITKIATNQAGVTITSNERVDMMISKQNDQFVGSLNYPQEFNTPFEEGFDTPFQDGQINISSVNDKQQPFNQAYLEQQNYLKQRAESIIQLHQKSGELEEERKVVNECKKLEKMSSSICKELIASNSTEGYDEITSEQKQYFNSGVFKEIVKNIIGDLSPQKEKYDRPTHIIIVSDAKWNRIYLKQIGMYIQLRVFPSKDTYSTYIDSYNKIVRKFIKFMPQTIFTDESKFIIIQKLGDFSLHDLSNLIFIQVKNHPKDTFEKYFMQTLSNLFESLILILSHNYYIGNINSKNVFISKYSSSFLIKFSNLVDISYDYTTVANKYYSTSLASKPTEIEIWFSELYGCCRCIQEMVEHDKYFLEKRNIKEFLNRHKQKYPRLMTVLQYFLLTRSCINFDALQQFILSSFRQENEKTIGLSDRTIKYIQHIVSSSQMHLTKYIPQQIHDQMMEQQLFFFMQQLYFHQDYEALEINYILRFLNRIFYSHLLHIRHTETEIFYLSLETLISDAAIFRRDKNLQKSTYLIYILFTMRSASKLEKAFPYWRFVSQTTSLLEQCSPSALYYAGLYNFLCLDTIKANKYFLLASKGGDFVDDILNINPFPKLQRLPDNKSPRNALKQENQQKQQNASNSFDDSSKGNSNNRQNLLKLKKKIEDMKSMQNKQIQAHSLFTSRSESDKTILCIREGYALLCKLRNCFIYENSIKGMELLIEELKSESGYKYLSKIIVIELQIMDKLKENLQMGSSSKNEEFFFVETISKSAAFNINQFSLVYKTILNSVNLTEIFRRQCLSSHSPDPLLIQVAHLFYAQTELQYLIADEVSKLKNILNLSPDTKKMKTLNQYNNNSDR